MIIFLASCKGEPEQVIEIVEEPPVAEVKYYKVMVDNLRARAGEDKSSEVIEKLAEFSIVKDLGQVSASKEEATLRGVEYNEPYIKVEVPSGKELWVYKGGLEPFYQGEEMAEMNKVSSFQSYLDGLDYKNLETGNAVLKRLLQLSTDDPATNDMLFFLSYDYMNRLAYNAILTDEKALDWAMPYYDQIKNRTFKNKDVYQGKSLEENGMLLDASEGMVYYQADVKALDGAIGGIFTDATKDYIQLLYERYQHRLFSDAAIVAELDLLMSDAVKWARFVENYPSYAKIEEIANQASYLKSAVMNGTNNTPSYDVDTKIILPKFRALWAKSIEDKSNPFSDELMKHFTQLEDNDWKVE